MNKKKIVIELDTKTYSKLGALAVLAGCRSVEEYLLNYINELELDEETVPVKPLSKCIGWDFTVREKDSFVRFLIENHGLCWSGLDFWQTRAFMEDIVDEFISEDIDGCIDNLYRDDGLRDYDEYVETMLDRGIEYKKFYEAYKELQMFIAFLEL